MVCNVWGAPTSRDTDLFSVLASIGWIIFLCNQLSWDWQSEEEDLWSTVNLVFHLISIIAVIANMSVACCCEETSLPDFGNQKLLDNQEPGPAEQGNIPAPGC